MSSNPPPPATPASPAAMERARELVGGWSDIGVVEFLPDEYEERHMHEDIARAIEAHTEAAVREAIERCAQRIEAARRDHGVGLDAAFFAGLVRALGKEGK